MKIFDCLKKCFGNLKVKESSSKNDDAKTKEQDKPNSKYISFDDFIKPDLRAGKVLSAERMEGSEKLIKFEIDFGELGVRTVVSGIAKYRNAEDLIGKTFLYIVNLEPRKIFGTESQAMLIALHDEVSDDFAMLMPDVEIKPGTKAG